MNDLIWAVVIFGVVVTEQTKQQAAANHVASSTWHYRLIGLSILIIAIFLVVPFMAEREGAQWRMNMSKADYAIPPEPQAVALSRLAPKPQWVASLKPLETAIDKDALPFAQKTQQTFQVAEQVKSNHILQPEQMTAAVAEKKTPDTANLPRIAINKTNSKIKGAKGLQANVKSRKLYRLQVATYANQNYAFNMKKKLQAMGIKEVLLKQRRSKKGRTLTLLLAGKSSDKAKIANLKQQIEQAFKLRGIVTRSIS